MKGRQVMRTVRTPRVCPIRHDRGVRRDQRIGLLVIVTGVFMLSLDVTMLDIVLPDIATAIGADQTEISWIADCYNVALAGLILVGAGLGGRFGQRRVYLSGLVIFGVGSIAASIVSDPIALIAARTVMGIGAAGLAAPAVALTGLMFTGEQRTRALAAWAAASGLGLGVGPIIGGLIISVANWRWIFLILVPFVAVMYVIGRAALPAGTTDDRPPLDMPGAVLSALALIPLVAALLQVPELGWTNPWVLAGISAGLITLAAFAIRETRARAPMIDVRVLRIPAVSATALALAASYVGFLGLQFLGAIQLRGEFDLDPVLAGLVLTPWAILYWIGARVGASLSVRLGAGTVILSGLAILTVACGVLALVSTASPLWVGAGMSLAGIGCGFITPVAVSLMLSSTPEALLPTSSGLSMVVRYGGGAVGLAVCASAVAVGMSAPWGYLAAGALVLVLGLGTAGFLRRGAASARLAAG